MEKVWFVSESVCKGMLRQVELDLSSQDCRHWMLCREASLFIGLGLLSSTSCSIAFNGYQKFGL